MAVGHGRSEIPSEGEPDDTWLVESLCQVMAAVLPGEGEKALVFGNSLGGLVAIRAALQCPERIAGLVLASPAGAPVTPSELSELKQYFRLETHEAGVAFMSRYELSLYDRSGLGGYIVDYS
jgi:pimeloyl-ACP methyl ester carboxylesterase